MCVGLSDVRSRTVDPNTGMSSVVDASDVGDDALAGEAQSGTSRATARKRGPVLSVKPFASCLADVRGARYCVRLIGLPPVVGNFSDLARAVLVLWACDGPSTWRRRGLEGV